MPTPHDPPPARGSGGVPDGLLLGLLGLLLASTVLVWTATGLAALLTHGSWPGGISIGESTLAVRALLGEPGDPAAAWPGADPGELGRPGLFWGIFVGQLMVLCVVAFTVVSALAGRRARKARRRAAAEAARAGTPAPDAPRTEPTASGHDAPAPTEEPTEPPTGPSTVPSAEQPVPTAPRTTPPVLTPAPAVGGLLLRRAAEPADALATAEGPALVVTANPALWSETVSARAKLGPTHLYDPTHAADAPVRLRWSPERGCHDMAAAGARAAALLAPVRSPAKADVLTHETAETILRCSLHAAAVSGQPFRQVHRWTTGGSTSEAVRILRKDKSAAPGAAGELESVLISHPERRDAATGLIRHALGALSQLHVRNSCTASKADALAVESFAAEGGTLYVMGEAIEDPRRHPGAMPLVTALTAYVVELGRRMAARSSSGRLDPPMTLVLDGPATVAPLPALPALLAEGPTYGLQPYAYLRSHDQAAALWPELSPSRSHLL